MSFIKVNGLTYEYKRLNEHGEDAGIQKALDQVSFEIEKGSFVAILGANGCGKSTLGRCINGLLVPKEGIVSVDGLLTNNEANILEIRQKVGMVFQNPDNQIVSSVVEEDVAFGPENLGLESYVIEDRITKALDAVDMTEYRYHATNRLSGGQKQRVAIAGVLAMEPDCIIFDEATAMLDPVGRAEILNQARLLNQEKGITILWITHFMEEIATADRVITMREGRIIMDGDPHEVFAETEVLNYCGLELPQMCRMARELNEDGIPLPAEILSREELLAAFYIGYEEIRNAVDDEERELVPADGIFGHIDIGLKQIELPSKEELNDESRAFDESNLMELFHASYTYGIGTPYEHSALNDVSLKVKAGEMLALIGPTGSGKSTLVRMLDGLCIPQDGEVLYGFERSEWHKKVGLLFQYPEHQLFDTSVLKDVSFGPKNLKLKDDEVLERASQALELVGLEKGYWNGSPFDLSGGEKRKAALAGVLAMGPQILVLDEPTAGLDPVSKREFYELLRVLCDQAGMTIVFVTHQMEDVVTYADRVVMLCDGKICNEGRPEEVFADRFAIEAAGLVLPETARLLYDCKKIGLEVDTTKIHFEEAKAEILNAWK